MIYSLFFLVKVLPLMNSKFCFKWHLLKLFKLYFHIFLDLKWQKARGTIMCILAFDHFTLKPQQYLVHKNVSANKDTPQRWHSWKQWQGAIIIRCIASYTDNTDPLSRPFSCQRFWYEPRGELQSIRTLWRLCVIGEVCNTCSVRPLICRCLTAVFSSFHGGGGGVCSLVVL